MPELGDILLFVVLMAGMGGFVLLVWLGWPKGRAYQIICPNPNCGYEGAAREREAISVGAFLFWLVVCFPVAILYALLRGGVTFYCPRCGIEIAAFKR